MVRTVDHNSRKNKILAVTVSTYINTGEPVSSLELARELALSSATIRNIMAELEEDGYLFAPHTSAGRVPSDKGYRYYVDFLMSGSGLSSEQKNAILGQYKSRSGSLEDILENTTEIIADFTHYTAIVSFSEWEDRIFYRGLSNIFQHPDFHDFQKLAVLVRLLEEKKQLIEILNRETDKTRRVYIGTEIECPYLSDLCSLAVSSYRNRDKFNGRIAVLGPRRMSYDQTLSALEFVSDTLTSILEGF
jgi:transcriptional regulator of heat shock response